MRINIADIKEQAGLSKSAPVQVSLEPVDFGGQAFQFPWPLGGEVQIWNSGDRLLVRATVSGEVIMPCSRCLTTFTTPLSVSFEEEFVQGAPDTHPEDEDNLGDERTVTFYQGDEIDLAEPLRENVLLQLPMKPLCSEGCKGLCPACGANWNEGSCDCANATHADPRLSVFKDLLREPDSNS